MLLLVQGLFLAPCHYRVGRCCERMRLTRSVGLKRVREQALLGGQSCAHTLVGAGGRQALSVTATGVTAGAVILDEARVVLLGDGNNWPIVVV
jgi:hypothetical protein